MLKMQGETKGQTDAAHQKAQDLYDKLAAHATMPERVEYLEKMVGEGANNHKKHKASVEERLEFVEESIGDSAEQHAKHDEAVGDLQRALDTLGGKHKDLYDLHHGEKSARDGHHAAMGERLDYLEKLMGDSADKHAALEEAHKALRDQHGATADSANKNLQNMTDKLEVHATLAVRVKYLEECLGESADKHSAAVDDLQKALDTLDGKHKDLHDLHHGDKSARDVHHSSVGERLDYIEQLMGDSADKHREIEEAHLAMQDHAGQTKTGLDAAHQMVQDLANQLEEHATLQQRVKYLEEVLGENADKHAKHSTATEELHAALRELDARHKDLKPGQFSDEFNFSTLTQRMEYMEQLLGDSADLNRDMGAAGSMLKKYRGQTKGFGSYKKVDELYNKLAANVSIDKRMSYIESFLGESAEKHTKHEQMTDELHKAVQALDGKHQDLDATHAQAHATTEQRLEYLEKCLDDSADKHTEMDEAQKTLQAAHGNTKDAHATLAERVVYLEKLLGESADKALNHKSTTDERLAYVEGLLGDSADKHGKADAAVDKLQKALDDLHGKHKELQDSHNGEKSARDQHHASIADRLAYMEQLMGDSADKHRELDEAHKAMQDLHGATADSASKQIGDLTTKLEEHATLAKRVKYLEEVLGDSADSHAKHASAVDDLQRALDALDGKHLDLHAHHASVGQRLDYMEKLMGDSADKHREIEEAHQALQNHHGATADSASKQVDDLTKKLEEHATLSERVKYLEGVLGESADEHAKHDSAVDGLQSALDALHGKTKDLHDLHHGDKSARDEHHASVGQRLEYLEKLMGDSADKHREIEEAHQALQNQHGATAGSANRRVEELTNKLEEHATLAERVQYLEKELGQFADEHAKHNSATDELQKAIDDLSGKQGKHSTLEQRLNYVEQLLGDSADKHSAMEDAHKKLNANHGKTKAELDQANQLVDDLAKRLEAHATIPQRINYLEKLLGDSADKHGNHEREFDHANQKIADVHQKLREHADQLQNDRDSDTAMHNDKHNALIKKIREGAAEELAAREADIAALRERTDVLPTKMKEQIRAEMNRELEDRDAGLSSIRASLEKLKSESAHERRERDSVLIDVQDKNENLLRKLSHEVDMREKEVVALREEANELKDLLHGEVHHEKTARELTESRSKDANEALEDKYDRKFEHDKHAHQLAMDSMMGKLKDFEDLLQSEHAHEKSARDRMLKGLQEEAQNRDKTLGNLEHEITEIEKGWRKGLENAEKERDTEIEALKSQMDSMNHQLTRVHAKESGVPSAALDDLNKSIFDKLKGELAKEQKSRERSLSELEEKLATELKDATSKSAKSIKDEIAKLMKIIDGNHSEREGELKALRDNLSEMVLGERLEMTSSMHKQSDEFHSLLKQEAEDREMGDTELEKILNELKGKHAPESVHPRITTKSTKAHKKGDKKIEVEHANGFEIGDKITIGGKEKHTITAFGSIVLRSPLRHDHPPGSEIVKVEDDEPSDDVQHSAFSDDKQHTKHAQRLDKVEKESQHYVSQTELKEQLVSLERMIVTHIEASATKETDERKTKDLELQRSFDAELKSAVASLEQLMEQYVHESETRIETQFQVADGQQMQDIHKHFQDVQQNLEEQSGRLSGELEEVRKSIASLDVLKKEVKVLEKHLDGHTHDLTHNLNHLLEGLESETHKIKLRTTGTSLPQAQIPSVSSVGSAASISSRQILPATIISPGSTRSLEASSTLTQQSSSIFMGPSPMQTPNSSPTPLSSRYSAPPVTTTKVIEVGQSPVFGQAGSPRLSALAAPMSTMQRQVIGQHPEAGTTSLISRQPVGSRQSSNSTRSTAFTTSQIATTRNIVSTGTQSRLASSIGSDINSPAAMSRSSAQGAQSSSSSLILGETAGGMGMIEERRDLTPRPHEDAKLTCGKAHYED